MRRLALLTTLALAGGTLTAAAEPQWRDRDRDYRDGYGYREVRRDRGWTQLAPVHTGRIQTQQIMLNGNHQRLHKLRIQAVRGAPVVTRVTIDYMHREAQVVPVNSRVSRGEGTVIRIDPNARIQRILVYTEPRYGGAYTVLGT
ncbi:MAG TPA: hypothetical protein VIU61_22155 [Kofleriaceae bacterium]